ncbi:pyrolysin [Ceratobasidium sp. AG-Ba]|nr:pyrolysin [Ceratobasidium sp. AG-Ba]
MVCKFWYNTTACAPSLWAHVDVYERIKAKKGPVAYISEHTLLWLQRAKGAAIHLHFSNLLQHSFEDSELARVFAPYAPSIASLEFCGNFHSQAVQDVLTVCHHHATPGTLKHLEICTTETIPILPSLDTVATPLKMPQAVTSLRLYGVHATPFFSMGQVLEMLSSSPQIHTLQLDDLFLYNSESLPTSAIPLHSLRVLDLTQRGDSDLPRLLSVISTGDSNVHLTLDFRTNPRRLVEAVKEFCRKSEVSTLVLRIGSTPISEAYSIPSVQNLALDLRYDGIYKNLDCFMQQAGAVVSVQRLYIVDKNRIPNLRERASIQRIVNICGPDELHFIGCAVMGAPPFDNWYDHYLRTEENMYEWLSKKVGQLTIDYPPKYVVDYGMKWDPLSLQSDSETCTF